MDTHLQAMTVGLKCQRPSSFVVLCSCQILLWGDADFSGIYDAPPLVTQTPAHKGNKDATGVVRHVMLLRLIKEQSCMWWCSCIDIEEAAVMHSQGIC